MDLESLLNSALLRSRLQSLLAGPQKQIALSLAGLLPLTLLLSLWLVRSSSTPLIVLGALFILAIPFGAAFLLLALVPEPAPKEPDTPSQTGPAIAEELHARLTNALDHAQSLRGLTQDLLGKVEGNAGQAEVVSAVMSQSHAQLSTITEHLNTLAMPFREISANAGRANEITSEVTEMTQHISKVVNLLYASSREIDEISETITKIAKKTHLLSFNATIEASRAGNAGQGFKVIADEVKLLNNIVRSTATSIRARIQTIQSQASETSTQVSQIRALAHMVSEAQQNISYAIDETAMMTNEVTQQLQELTASTQEISGNMDSVAELVRETVNGLFQAQDSGDACHDELQQVIEHAAQAPVSAQSPQPPATPE